MFSFPKQFFKWKFPFEFFSCNSTAPKPHLNIKYSIFRHISLDWFREFNTIHTAEYQEQTIAMNFMHLNE